MEIIRRTTTMCSHCLFRCQSVYSGWHTFPSEKHAKQADEREFSESCARTRWTKQIKNPIVPMAFLSTPPIFSNSISSLFKCKRMPSAFRHSSILAKRSSKTHTALSLSHFFSSSHIVSRFPNRRTHLSENIQAASFLNGKFVFHYQHRMLYRFSFF